MAPCTFRPVKGFGNCSEPRIAGIAFVNFARYAQGMKKTLALVLPSLILMSSTALAWVQVTPQSLDYGAVRLGMSSSRWFTVQNWGPQATRVFGCSTFGSFWCQLQCPFILGPGQWCNGIIHYSPRTEGNEFQNAQIQTQDGFPTVFLRGTGIR